MTSLSPEEQHKFLDEYERELLMEEVIKQIIAEREYQMNKVGWSTEWDDNNKPHEWAGYITHYLGRNLAGDPMNIDSEKFRNDLLKVASLAVAAIESLDRKNKPKAIA